MKVRVMQWVDYWVGVPLCAVVSGLRRIFARRRNTEEIPLRRILLIELSEMGSAILAYPMMQKLLRDHAGVELYFLIFRRNRASVDLLGVIDQSKVLVIEERSFPQFVLSTLRMIVTLRRLRFDAVIDLELFSRFTALMSFLSGALRRVGFHNYTAEGLYRGSFITDQVYYNPHRHIALNFLSLAGALSSPVRNEIPRVKENFEKELVPLPQISLAPAVHEKVLGRLHARGLGERNLVLLNPDPGDALPLRGWPIPYYRELVERLLASDPSLTIVLIGLLSSMELNDQVLEGLDQSRAINFAGATDSLEELVALFHHARLLITNDSGPAHMAALTPIKTMVLFGPETPSLYGPLGNRTKCFYAALACSPCVTAFNHRRSPCRNNRCMQEIAPAIVFEEARNLLS